MMQVADPLNRKPTAADRRRWDDLHAAQATARAAYDELDRALSLKYGIHYERTWLKKGDRDRLEQLRARADKVGDKIIELLVRISPRGHAWLSGAPAHWIRYELTWEDAVRPAGEPLSVTVPAPYGASRGLTEAAPHTLSDEAILQAIWDLGDADYAAGFARADTRALAQHFGVEPAAMLQRMQRLAREGRVSRVRDTLSRTGRRRVGWQQWETTWVPPGLAEAGDAAWEDYLAPGEARYVPDVVLPQMPDIVARAAAAGMPEGAEYMGAGMTGAVFCVGETAFKVARRPTPTLQRMLGEEAEWLVAAGNVLTVAPHVARLHRFDPENAVIVRACPRKDPDQPLSRWESRLYDLHRAIDRDMLPHGWTAPEFKPDSYVLTAGGPILVDASMPSRVGGVLARYVERVASGELDAGDDSPSDLAFYVRREVGQTLTQADADRLQALLERRWPGSTGH